MSAAGWRMPTVLAGGDPLGRAAVALAAEFPGFDIRTCQGRQGRSLVALRRGGSPGLTAVITPDPDEMRRLLNEDSPDSPPGAGGNAAPGGD